MPGAEGSPGLYPHGRGFDRVPPSAIQKLYNGSRTRLGDSREYHEVDGRP